MKIHLNIESVETGIEFDKKLSGLLGISKRVLFHCNPVNQRKNIDICINFMGRPKTKPFLK
jgi:hypothetical protein